ncbi:MAG: hypothetical protein IKN42_00480 [Elusimicrobia bacterium]|nr:hypothetical protein [Elusimicrobiota bacterium]
MKIKIILLLFAVVLNTVAVFAYVTYPKAVLSVDENSIDVGNIVKATVEITIPPFAKLLQTEDDISIEGWDIQDFHFKQDILDECKFILDLSITTFNSKLDSVSKVKLSYVNKDDLLDDSFFCDKFYFFSNSVPIKVNSIFSNYKREEIFDIKNIKEMNIPIIFYFLCILFVLFVCFVIYRDILILKIKEENEFVFSPREKAIRTLNGIYNNKEIRVSDINDNYYLMSRTLKIFILEMLEIKNKEMTTMEVLDILSKETNPFHKNYQEILSLFKIYDSVKYSIGLLSLKDFFDVFNKTKKLIKNLSVSVKKDIEESND